MIVVVAALAVILVSPDDDHGGGGGTWELSSGDYLNYTISWSNGTVIGYWKCRIVEVIPEVQSVTWNITQTFGGYTSQFQVATNINHILTPRWEMPIGIINETTMQGLDHNTVSLSTNWGSKSCDHWYSDTVEYCYFNGVLMKYTENIEEGVHDYVMTLTDTSLAMITG